MHETIERLRPLFAQREAIDAQIAEILEGKGEVKHEIPVPGKVKRAYAKKPAVAKVPKVPGLRKTRKRLDETDKAGIVRDFGSGMDKSEIMEKYDISSNTLWRLTQGVKRPSESKPQPEAPTEETEEEKKPGYTCNDCDHVSETDLPPEVAYCFNCQSRNLTAN